MKEENKDNRNKKIYIILGTFVIVLVTFVFFLLLNYLFEDDDGFENEETKPEIVIPSSPDEKASPYRMSSNSLEEFDLSFLKLENKLVNKVYSPLSIKYALQMLSEGASGKSKTQIDNIIGSYKYNKYTNSKNMSFANGIFVRDDYKKFVKDDYINTLKNKYDADVLYDSFNTPDKVNSWVSDKTFNLVDKLFDDISRLDFVLVNALAIDMEWKQMIQATNETYYDEFFVSYDHESFGMYIPVLMGDNYESIDFNSGKDNALVVEIGAAINKYDIIEELGEENIRRIVGEAYQQWSMEGNCGGGLPVDTFLDSYIKALDSNYGRLDVSTDFLFYVDDKTKVFAKDLKEYNGTNLQYVGIMPINEELNTYIENVSAKDISTLINNLKDVKLTNFKDGVVTKITGYIPLFKFDYELDFMNDLKKLGIVDVFDDENANLSSMVKKFAYISAAAHKANIEFSNEGVKAAAVTGFGGMGNAACEFEYNFDVPVEEIDLTFDNPYLFLIRDKNTGEVWFTGTVYEPISK